MNDKLELCQWNQRLGWIIIVTLRLVTQAAAQIPVTPEIVGMAAYPHLGPRDELARLHAEGDWTTLQEKRPGAMMLWDASSRTNVQLTP